MTGGVVLISIVQQNQGCEQNSDQLSIQFLFAIYVMSAHAKILGSLEAAIRKAFRQPTDRSQASNSNPHSTHKSHPKRKHSQTSKTPSEQLQNNTAPLETIQKHMGTAIKTTEGFYRQLEYQTNRRDAPSMSLNQIFELVHPLVKCADQLVNFVDSRPPSAEQTLSNYVNEREKLLSILLQKNPDKQSVATVSIFEQPPAQTQNHQRGNLLSSKIIAELSELKLRFSELQQKLYEKQLQTQQLRRQLEEVENILSFQQNRLSKEKQKVRGLDFQMERVRGIIRKITQYENLEEYFWALNQFQNSQQRLDVINKHEQAICSLGDQISSAWIEKEEQRARRRRSTLNPRDEQSKLKTIVG